MTAIPQDGLRRGALAATGSVRAVGARLIKPSSIAEPKSARFSAAMTAGTATVRSSAIGISQLAGSIGVKPIRLVITGRRVRLGNGAFVLMVLGLLTSILIALLFLNTSLAEGSFALTNARVTTRSLAVKEQILNEQIAAAGTTAGLTTRARNLGMVSPSSPVFLELSSGKVLGDGVPAVAPPMPKVKKPKAIAPAAAAPLTAGAVEPGGESVAVAIAGVPGSVMPTAPTTSSVVAAGGESGAPIGSTAPSLPLTHVESGGETSLGLVVGSR